MRGREDGGRMEEVEVVEEEVYSVSVTVQPSALPGPALSQLSVSSERWQDPPAMSDSDLPSPQQTEQKIKGPGGWKLSQLPAEPNIQPEPDLNWHEMRFSDWVGCDWLDQNLTRVWFVFLCFQTY